LFILVRSDQTEENECNGKELVEKHQIREKVLGGETSHESLPHSGVAVVQDGKSHVDPKRTQPKESHGMTEGINPGHRSNLG